LYSDKRYLSFSWQEMQNSSELVASMPVLKPPQKNNAGNETASQQGEHGIACGRDTQNCATSF